MKKIIVIIGFALLLFSSLFAQKVGLVLSGGGARGIAHIGIIKALEENNIPIDYITGTSMGAIVGGLYANGLAPDEIAKILKSDDFIRWSTGEIESNYIYYYRNADPRPTFVELPFRISRLDSLKLKPNILPTNLISPRQMNYAFLPMFAQANALCGGDFDKLFVPFRCVASDIYKKEAVVLSRGSLGDAVRASMTFPFMFKPLLIDNRLLFDGGIFNNFPVDVMRKDFNPDFMIGSVVSKNPPKPDEQDIVEQIQNMIMSHTDYTLPSSGGLLLDFKLNEIKTFDFSKVDELLKIGYDSTMAHMDEIKARVSRRVSCDSVAERRKQFCAKFPELKFMNVTVHGVDKLQKQYVERMFHSESNVFDLLEFKKTYFKLISDDKISEVLPQAIYNPSTGFFNLQLNVKTQAQLKVLLGGNVSSSTSNQAFFGMTYQNISDFARTSYFDAQFGRMYNGLGIGSRVELPTQKSWYVKFAVVLHKFDYFKGNRLFYEDDRTAYFTQNEVYGKLSAGFPILMKGRMEFGLGYGLLGDYYQQDLAPSQTSDKSVFSLGSVFARAESSTLNDLMYPTKGAKYSSSLQFLGGEETFRPAIGLAQTESEGKDFWVQAKIKADNYFSLNSRFTLGASGELAFSTRNLLQNYTVNVIQAPVFQPTPHSRTVFNDAFSANRFAVVGIKPIYNLSKQLHLRNETYWFVPYKAFYRTDENAVAYKKAFTVSEFMTETSLVFNFKIASASMFVNYYSSAASRWNLGVNIGFLLFNPKFTE